MAAERDEQPPEGALGRWLERWATRRRRRRGRSSGALVRLTASGRRGAALRAAVRAGAASTGPRHWSARADRRRAAVRLGGPQRACRGGGSRRVRRGRLQAARHATGRRGSRCARGAAAPDVPTARSCLTAADGAAVRLRGAVRAGRRGDRMLDRAGAGGGCSRPARGQAAGRGSRLADSGRSRGRRPGAAAGRVAAARLLRAPAEATGPRGARGRRRRRDAGAARARRGAAGGRPRATRALRTVLEDVIRALRPLAADRVLDVPGGLDASCWAATAGAGNVLGGRALAQAPAAARHGPWSFDRRPARLTGARAATPGRVSSDGGFLEVARVAVRGSIDPWWLL